MPIYEYECTRCGERSEILQRMGDPPPDGCGKCGQPVKRLLSAPSFQFKGTGWYVTDYADKRKKSDGKSSTPGKGSDKASSEAKTSGEPGGGDSSAGESSDSKASSRDKASKKSSAGGG